MMKKVMWRVLFLCAVVGVANAPAQMVRVTKGVADRINIAIEPFGGDTAGAQQIASVLANDLVRSDWFNYVAAPNAEFIVRGSVAGATLNGAVYRRGGSAPVLQKACASESNNLRAVAHQMADEIVRAIAQKPGIAQTKIAFVANGTGAKELYVMDYDGANVKRLTSDGSLAARPRFGPNRRTVAFTSYRSGWPDVYMIMDIMAPSTRRISAYPGLNTGGAISPDGRKLALILSRDGNPELYVMDLGGGGLTRLTKTRQAESSPCWSPDGTQICFVSDRAGSPQLYAVAAGGGEAKRITFGGYKAEPDWAPWWPMLGCGILPFARAWAGSFSLRVELALRRRAQSDGRRGRQRRPTWAPDGRHIAFSKTSNYRKSLYILDAFTARAIEVNPNLRVLGDCSTPAWSR